MDPDRTLRILVVEDDFLVGEMVSGLLEDLGYVVAGEARDGRQAIELTRRLKPDVVVMDIEMPYLDGLQATLGIHDCCPTPVVILTAYETPQLLERAEQAGVGAYLVKPPRARELERAITIARARFRDMLALRRLYAELEERSRDLQAAQQQVETLRGLLPICVSCHKVRDDAGYWRQIETHLREHTTIQPGAGLCPDCARKFAARSP